LEIAKEMHLQKRNQQRLFSFCRYATRDNLGVQLHIRLKTYNLTNICWHICPLWTMCKHSITRF